MKKLNTKPQPPTIPLLITQHNTNITLTKITTNLETASTQGDPNETRFTRKTNRYEILRNQHKNYKEIHLMQLLMKFLQRRKRYSFQMVKLVYLFPDDSFSENVSVNSYDRLFYQDQHIHTIVKIYQTKQMQSKIWAFLNLKTLHKRKKLQKFTEKVENVEHKLIIHTKKNTFDLLHQYSLKIHSQRPITIQPLTPLNTKIQTNTIKVDQTTKTQRIQRNITNNFTRIQRNQIIRVEEPYSPIVRRIHLTPDDVKIIYPGTIRQANTRESSANKVYNSPSHVEKIVEKQHIKQTNNRQTYLQQKNIYERKPSTIYVNQTIKRIQPVQIKTIPSNISNIYHTQSRQHHTKLRDPAYQYLVHTVHGNCTINIYNGPKNQQKKQPTIQLQPAKQVNHSTPTPSIQGHIENHQTNCRKNCLSCQGLCGNYCCCGRCSCCLGHSHCVGVMGHIHHEYGYGYGGFHHFYSIQERMQYLRRLEDVCRDRDRERSKKKMNKQ